MNITARSIHTVALTVLIVTGTAAACGDDAPEPAPAATASGDASGAEEADVAEITIEGFEFTGVTEVAVGTTVIVTNADTAAHTWTADDGTFDSGSLAQGESFEFTFDEPGEYSYTCLFHPSMVGTIIVTG